MNSLEGTVKAKNLGRELLVKAYVTLDHRTKTHTAMAKIE